MRYVPKHGMAGYIATEDSIGILRQQEENKLYIT
jgi:hypothetical protein